MSPGPRTSISINLNHQDQNILESWQRSMIIPALLAMRGRVILLLAAGKSVTQTSQIAGSSRQLTYKWARRFVQKGITGLERSSRPKARTMDHESKKSAQKPALTVSEEDRKVQYQKSGPERNRRSGILVPDINPHKRKPFTRLIRPFSHSLTLDWLTSGND